MTLPTGVPGDEVPQEDWAEQATEVAPPGEAASTGGPTPGSLEVDEADRAEQDQPVELDDEDR